MSNEKNPPTPPTPHPGQHSGMPGVPATHQEPDIDEMQKRGQDEVRKHQDNDDRKR